MVETKSRRVALVVVRDAVCYPVVAAGVAFVLASVLSATFGTVLFAVFAVAAIATGFGAMSGSASSDALNAGAGLTATSQPGERWGGATLVRLGLFDLGLAAILTAHALWWA
ncbi:hypothetical protein [Salinigranum halophilum]|jgi:hypothetical protein|uniref:hypothetical protein n=1 Tax=Salinigranum halophilum TaxID=2565931 RepID=UPI0010A8D731|nr:hypothetical protein [Salinigranum halophilum]